jgi:hypothetical protein
VAAIVINAPWPKSPNITAKIKGKVTTVYSPGFDSKYFGIPYTSTIF